MNLTEPFWKHVVWVNFVERRNTQWTDVIYFVEKFKAILQYDKVEINRLYEECFDYKTFGNDAIPHEVFSEGKINEKEYRNDVLWHQLANLSQDFFFMHFCPGTITTHAESINSDLQRGLDRRLRHIQH